jgi:hypothetical protein
MNLETLTDFFMWSTILNIAVMFVWVGAMVLAPGMVYRTQSAFFSISRERFDQVMYGFMGLYKLMIITFSLVPYVALRIIE